MGIGKLLIGIGLGVAGIRVAENEKVQRFVRDVTKKPRETFVKGLRDLADAVEKVASSDAPASSPAAEKKA